MDVLSQWYRAGLPASIEALKAARKTLAKFPGSLESIRRIARSLQASAEANGFSDLGDAARHVEASRPEDVQPLLERLLAELTKLSGGVPSGVSPVILVIEADPQMARLLETLLAGPDRDIRLARSAGEAMTLLQETQVTLVILDLGLPDTDGR
ncbi:MAG TPA: response regulator, partial [Fibrobacteria bacterium]|nr:response regulator [Fibrobacteria bacterium]